MSPEHVLIAVLAWFLWCQIGAAILAFVDRDGRILDWWSRAPHLIALLLITLWPGMVWAYYR